MSELALRYLGILAIILAGILVSRFVFPRGDGRLLARTATSVLFPAYVFGSLAALDATTFSFASGLRISGAVFTAAALAYFIFSRFYSSPYPFVCSSKNFRSLGVPLLYFRFYDSTLQEVALFSVLGMAVFESVASLLDSDKRKENVEFPALFFAAFALGSLAYWAGITGRIDYGLLNVSALLGKGVAGYAYSVLSLFFIGYAVASIASWRNFRTEIRQSFPVLLSQSLVWPAFMASILVLDAHFSGFVTGGIAEVTSALMILSFMPASVTSAAILARSWNLRPSKWVAVSILFFLLYAPFLLGSAAFETVFSVLDFESSDVQSP